MRYAAYDCTDEVIWGLGHTKAGALADAESELLSFHEGDIPPGVKLEVALISRSLVELVEGGGGDVAFDLAYGVLVPSRE